jgi:hypothetical protein
MTSAPGPLRVELTAAPRGGALMLTVAGYLLPVTGGTIAFGTRFPQLEVSLPVVDGLVVSLDADVRVAEETWAALVAMGWRPPDEELPAPDFIAKALGAI